MSNATDEPTENLNELMVLDPEMQKRIKNFKKEWYKFYKDISKEKTPQVDGTGKKIVDTRPDGYDFIIEAYMRDCLDRHFPGWSWEMGGAPQFLGSEWVFVWGTLCIVDEKLLAFDIRPPIRKFSATNGVRIKFGRGKSHAVENVIDIGNDVASANSKAFKKAVNQLTHIGDDVYGKRIEEEGAGSLEDVVMASGGATDFGRWIADNKVKWSFVFETLRVNGVNEITDFKEAIRKIKKAKGWQ